MSTGRGRGRGRGVKRDADAIESGVGKLNLSTSPVQKQEPDRPGRKSPSQQERVVTEPKQVQPRSDSLRKEMDVKNFERFTRAKLPEKGKRIDLYTNYYNFDRHKDWVIYSYSLQFKPEVVDKNFKRKTLYEYRKNLGANVFAGNMLFTTIVIKNKELDFKLHDGTRGSLFINFSGELSPEHPYCMQIYNILFRQMLYAIGMREIGKNYFSPDKVHRIAQHSLEVWEGCTFSVQRCIGGISIIVDPHFKVLCTKSVLELLYDLYTRAEEEKRNFESLVRYNLVGRIILTRYNNKTYTIGDIDFSKNPLSKFKIGDGKEMSFADYMYQQYKLTVTDQKQPLLVIPKSRKIGKELHIVPELCYLTGIPESLKTDFKVKKALTNVTQLNPSNRNILSTKIINNIKGNSECKELLFKWHINISNKCILQDGIQLRQETLYCARKEEISGYDERKADWSYPLRNKGLMNKVPIENWMVLVNDGSKHIMDNFLGTFNKVCRGMDVPLDRPTIVNVGYGKKDDYVKSLRRDVRRSNKPQIVVTILPRNTADVYNAIKKLCYYELGVLNQCVVSKTIGDPKKLLTVTTKIVMLISVKIGADPWHVNIPMSRLMVIGIDSYHDAVDKDKGSVQAFVASINPTLTKYYNKVGYSHQYGELTDTLTTFTAGALRSYKALNDGNLPEIILVYRDGVGDGQLQTVKNYEIEQIKNAFKNIDSNNMPQLVFVVCQKRLKARFSIEERGGRLVNPLPGTIIAGEISKTQDWEDFYMISQSVKEGSVGPTRYIILHNDTTKITTDRLQTLTFKLCHLYYNWQATVQVPAPVQYAHKMAYMHGGSLCGDQSMGRRNQDIHDDLWNKFYYL